MSGEAVCHYLADRGIPFAVIGAQAMILRGVVRFSLDTDLLTMESAVLSAAFWNDFPNAEIDVRRGDLTDPLAGVVRFTFADDQVDVIVGKYKWQRGVIERSRPVETIGVPVVQKADLILLKLFAGGPQDMWDVHALLASDRSVAAEVDERIIDLSDDVQELWRGIRDLQ
jgi:hypothetical protein